MTSTAIRQAGGMSPDEPFDPLIDLDGLWTTELAERYLPIPGAPLARYECWDGRLFMTPYEAAQNSYGELELGSHLRAGVKAAGLYLYGPINLTMGGPSRWVQPDLTVLSAPFHETWVPAEACVMVIEFVSPTSRKRDRLDKPTKCAAAKIPWYMTVELDVPADRAVVELRQLSGDRYRSVASAVGGSLFEMDEPFAASFDPSDLLVR
jgi:Uma2 family endonuclease